MKYFVYVIGILAIFSCHDKQAASEESLEDKALRIHKKILTIDTHNDININNFTDSVNYTQRLSTQVNLPKMEEGGLDVSWMIVYTGQDTLSPQGYMDASMNAVGKFEAIHRLCESIAPDKIAMALNSEDVYRIHETGKKVAMIGVENAYPMGEGLVNFKRYHELGARYVSLAHNGHNQFSDSHTGEEEDVWLHNGLSELGKKAVKEMNRLGIMIDVSHTSKEATLQMLALSKAPIIASHSSARALCNHSRNLDDEQLELLKENGGVVQTVAFGPYLNAKKDSLYQNFILDYYKTTVDSLNVALQESFDFNAMTDLEREIYLENHPLTLEVAQKKALNQPNAPPAVDIVDLVDHIDYMVNLIGIDHVGISSDFDGGGGIVGWSDASETFNVTLELVRRGYSEPDIAKLWGGNLLRVLDEVQAIARSYENP